MESPSHAPPVNESILLNLLRTRTDKKDTLVYAHAASETQNTINENYQSSSSRGKLSPSQAAPGFLEVQIKSFHMLQIHHILTIIYLLRSSLGLKAAPLVYYRT